MPHSAVFMDKNSRESQSMTKLKDHGPAVGSYNNHLYNEMGSKYNNTSRLANVSGKLLTQMSTSTLAGRQTQMSPKRRAS